MEFNVVIDPIVAKSEIDKLLDQKNIYPRRREQLDNTIDTLIDAISYGHLVITDTGGFNLSLMTPIKDKSDAVVLDKLEFKPRVKPDEMLNFFRSNKSITIDEKMAAAIRLHSGQAQGLLDKLEPSDRYTVDAIGFFYLL